MGWKIFFLSFFAVIFLFNRCRKDQDFEGDKVNTAVDKIGLRENVDTSIPYSSERAQLFAYMFYNNWISLDNSRLQMGLPYYAELMTFYDHNHLDVYSRNVLPLVDIHSDTIISLLFINLGSPKLEWSLLVKKDLMKLGDSTLMINELGGKFTGNDMVQFINDWDRAMVTDPIENYKSSSKIGLRGGEDERCGGSGGDRGKTDCYNFKEKRWRGYVDGWANGFGKWARKINDWLSRWFHGGGLTNGGSKWGTAFDNPNSLYYSSMKWPTTYEGSDGKESFWIDKYYEMWSCVDEEVDDDRDDKTKKRNAKPDKEFCEAWSDYYNRCLKDKEEWKNWGNAEWDMFGSKWAQMAYEHRSAIDKIIHSLKCTSSEELECALMQLEYEASIGVDLNSYADRFEYEKDGWHCKDGTFDKTAFWNAYMGTDFTEEEIECLLEYNGDIIIPKKNLMYIMRVYPPENKREYLNIFCHPELVPPEDNWRWIPKDKIHKIREEEQKVFNGIEIEEIKGVSPSQMKMNDLLIETKDRKKTGDLEHSDQCPPDMEGVQMEQGDDEEEDKYILRLEQQMRSLLQWTSRGELEEVAMKCMDFFLALQVDGGEMVDPILSKHVAQANSMKDFVKIVAKKLEDELNKHKGDIDGFGQIYFGKDENPRPKFSSSYHRSHGLKILINDTYKTYVYVDRTSYKYDKKSKTWSVNLYFEIIDHFGLDKNKREAINYQGNYLHPITGANIIGHDGFAAWYRLQHCYDHVPFTTKEYVQCKVKGKLNY